MSAAIAAGLGTDPEWPRSVETVTSELNRLACELQATSDRAFTVEEAETRAREAAQVRFVAQLVTHGRHRDTGEMWITAASRMIIAHDLADQEAVYAERAERRHGQ